MTDNININEGKTTFPLKWLQFLFYFYAAGVIVSAVSKLLNHASWLTWVDDGIGLGIIVCLFLLGQANGRYRKAAIFKIICLGCTLIPLLLQEPIVLYVARENPSLFGLVTLSLLVFTLVASILSLLAVYQEYRGHAETTAENAKLSRNWGRLLIGTILISMLIFCISFVMSFLLTAMPNLMAISLVINIVNQTITTVLQLLHLCLLYLTLRFCQA